MNKELLTRLIYTKTRERYNEEVDEASLYQKTLQEVAKKAPEQRIVRENINAYYNRVQ